MSIDDKLKKLLEENKEVWKSESAFLSYIRGGVRRSLWNRHPVKTKLINSKRKQIANPNQKGKKPTVWGGECDICKGLFISSELQVDHIRENGSSLKCISDVQKFIEDIVVVTEDDLRWVCINCHSIVSHSQKNGISFEQAKVEKRVISLDKENKVLDVLSGLGASCIPTTKIKRKALLLEILLKDLESKDV